MTTPLETPEQLQQRLWPLRECHECGQQVRSYNAKGGLVLLNRHAAPGQEHLPESQRKPCRCTSAALFPRKR
jgi:hypothetical protein